MKQALAFAVVATVVSLVLVAPAGAGSAKAPTLRSLQAQITSLQKQVKALKKRTTQAEDVAFVALAFGACSTAVTADTFQDTYTGLNGYFGAHALPAYFGAQTPVGDYGACQAFKIVRAHNQNPPTTAVLGALLDLFKPAAAGARQSFMSLRHQPEYVFGRLFVVPR
jgi:hypothetical protein